MFTKSRIQGRSRRGAMTVEFALCLPILLLFLFGCYEIATANMMLHATEAAAYEAARVGIVPGAKQEEIEKAAKFVLNSVGIKDFEVEVTPDPIVFETEKVTVRIIVPYDANTISVSRLFIKDPTLRAKCEMLRETL